MPPTTMPSKPPMDQEQLEREIKDLIVTSLMLDDVDPQQIDSHAPLFGEGLGLDSIDALELGMAISKKFGVPIKSDDPRIREIFQSVHSLATYVAGHESAVDAQTVFERIVAFMAERFEIDGSKIELTTRFYEDLDLDSIDAVDLAIELREMTGSEIEEHELRQIRTVSDVVDLVMRLQAGAQAD